MKQIMLPEMNALIATEVISGRFSGHIALNEPIIMPSELGLAKPQMANVAIAELRNCGKEKHVNCPSLSFFGSANKFLKFLFA